MALQITTRRLLFRSIYFLLLAVLTISIFISCEKDEVIDPIGMVDPVIDPVNDIVITHNADLFDGNISGRVVNKDLDPIGGVTIKIRGEETITDDNGYFYFRAITLDAQGTIVESTLEGYWPITKVVVPSKSQENQTRIILQPIAEEQSIEASNGGTVNFDETIKIDFQSNSFVNSNGDLYDGVVKVSAIYLDPNDENFGSMSPGDFRAFNLDSELQTLMSLGMIGVELSGTNDEVLELKEETVATLSIKVPEGTTVDEVPLWHFDEESGYWLEEAVAKQEGGFYVGDVSHFSWWNFDIPFFTVNLSGSVINDNAMGIAGLEVSIVTAEDRWYLGSGYTGAEGTFSIWIPKDQSLILQIRNECGDIFYEEPIGPFSEDTDLAAVSSTTQNIIEVCGNMVNCDEEVVTNGYLVVRHDGNQSFIPVDGNGDFCSTVNICESIEFELYGIDLTSGLEDLPTAYSLGDSPIADLELSACDQSSAVFRYQINNEPEIIITDFTISQDDNIVGFGGNYEINGEFPTVFFDGSNWGTNDFDFGYYNVNIASPTTKIYCDFTFCSRPTLEVVEYGGVGNPVILSIEGTTFENDIYSIYVNGILE